MKRLLTAGLACAGLAVSGCSASGSQLFSPEAPETSHPSSDSTTEEAGFYDVKGTVRVPGASKTNHNMEPCGYVLPDYSDIDVSTEVLVRGSDGDLLGQGKLMSSPYFDDGYCVFGFRVDELPDTSEFYTFTVGARDERGATYKADEMSSAVELQIGESPIEARN